MESIKLAIFDVDFTLTKRETLVEFYLFMVKKRPYLIFHLPKSAISAMFYFLNVYDAGKAKEKFISFVDGIKEDEMQKLVKEFYQTRLSKIFYKDAMDMMKKLKDEGCKIYLISASAEFYLNELYNIGIVDKIIGTRFKVDNGVIRGKINGNNCKGQEKVERLMEVIKKENMNVDFKNSYMFSDSLSDLPLDRKSTRLNS